MNLESLLKPVKEVDEEILRKYSKFVKNQELKGESRYKSCCLGTALFSIGTMAFLCNDVINGVEIRAYIYGSCSTFIALLDTARTQTDLEKQINFESEIRIFSPEIEFIKTISGYLRLPYFLSAIGFGIKSLVELYKGLIHQEPETLSQSLTDFVIATGFFGISSSMYLKDADPNILKKDPLLKRMYNWAKEKVSSYIPVPQPVPVQAYSRLEEIID